MRSWSSSEQRVSEWESRSESSAHLLASRGSRSLLAIDTCQSFHGPTSSTHHNHAMCRWTRGAGANIDEGEWLPSSDLGCSYTDSIVGGVCCGLLSDLCAAAVSRVVPAVLRVLCPSSRFHRASCWMTRDDS